MGAARPRAGGALDNRLACRQSWGAFGARLRARVCGWWHGRSQAARGRRAGKQARAPALAAAGPLAAGAVGGAQRGERVVGRYKVLHHARHRRKLGLRRPADLRVVTQGTAPICIKGRRRVLLDPLQGGRQHCRRGHDHAAAAPTAACAQAQARQPPRAQGSPRRPTVWAAQQPRQPPRR